MKKLFLFLTIMIFSLTVTSQVRIFFFRDVPPIHVKKLYAAFEYMMPRFYNLSTEFGGILDMPKASYCEKNKAYDADHFLESITDTGKVLAVTYRSLVEDCLDSGGYHGLAQGKKALITLYDVGYVDRLLKIALHEVGHLEGLEHCPYPLCLMHEDDYEFSLDLKQALCPACIKQLTKLL